MAAKNRHMSWIPRKGRPRPPPIWRARVGDDVPFGPAVWVLCSFLLALPAAAQPSASSDSDWIVRVQIQLRRLQEQAQQQAAQAEQRIRLAEQILQQSQDAVAAAQASGNLAAAQTAQQAQSRALAARERARLLHEVARRSAERALSAAQSLQRQVFSAPPQASDALLALQTGLVHIDRPAQPAAPGTPAEAATLLHSGDTIRTAAASQARFFLADGHSQLAVDENTVLTYGDNGQRTTLELLQGRIRLAIEKWAKSFEVHTPTAICAVRGTRFSVAHGGSEAAATEVRVMEGVVEVRPLQTDAAAIAVPAGMRLLLLLDGRVQGPLALDTPPDDLLDGSF